LLALPVLLRVWITRGELAGKALAFQSTAAAAPLALLKCLASRPAGGLVLEISAQNQFYDRVAAIVVRIEDRGDLRVLQVWSEGGRPLTPGQLAHVQTCLDRPPD